MASKKYAEVERNRCVACGVCVKECPILWKRPVVYFIRKPAERFAKCGYSKVDGIQMVPIWIL